MRSVWLLRGGDVLASGDVTETWGDRLRGLRGHVSYDRALVVLRARTAHSAGVQFGLDVAFLDADLRVLATTQLRPWSIARPRLGAVHVLQAQAGAFERWRLLPGDEIELRETS